MVFLSRVVYQAVFRRIQTARRKARQSCHSALFYAVAAAQRAAVVKPMRFGPMRGEPAPKSAQ
jgi:hypothetical protein